MVSKGCDKELGVLEGRNFVVDGIFLHCGLVEFDVCSYAGSFIMILNG